MIIAMSGASGFVGAALSAYLENKGHRIVPIVRTGRSIQGDVVNWDPESGWIDTERLRYCEGVIHLAGENIACKWTESEKREIYESRVHTAGLLCRGLSEIDSGSLKFFICASSTGCYGDRGDEVIDEKVGYGEGFLAELCEAWEFASIKLSGKTRIVNLRFGMILGKDGGILKRMLPVFQSGLGGKFGSGKQYCSWITLEDAVSVVEFIIDNETICGPVNVVSPGPVTNREFTKVLGKVLGRPTLLGVPRSLLRMVMGEFAKEVLLTSVRAEPKKLIESGFKFEYPELEAALGTILRADMTSLPGR
jgi:uncharacterized protein